LSQPYKPIDCDDYDFLEIACMDGYTLDVVMPDKTITGKAVTTKKNADGEFLVLQMQDGEQELVRADQIIKLVVLDKNPRFNERVFTRS